jgi:transcriptional regulator with XRE-family HTH domain
MSLKQIRQKKGMTLRQVADLSGVDFTTVSRIENGVTSQPAYATIIKIARALGVKADALLDHAKEAQSR